MFQKSVFVFLCLALIAASVQAGGPSSRLYGNKKHPTLDDHCYYEDGDLKVSVKLHDTAFPTNIHGKCVKIECFDDFVVNETTCQSSQSAACNQPFDETKPYPYCCPCH